MLNDTMKRRLLGWMATGFWEAVASHPPMPQGVSRVDDPPRDALPYELGMQIDLARLDACPTIYKTAAHRIGYKVGTAAHTILAQEKRQIGIVGEVSAEMWADMPVFYVEDIDGKECFGARWNACIVVREAVAA